MVDRATILAACFEVLSVARAPRSPFDLAAPLGISVGQVIAAMDTDRRFSRIAGAGCWWWSVEAKLTKAERARREREIRAAGQVHVAKVRDDERVAAERRERVRAALSRSVGGATAPRLAESASLTVVEVEDVLRVLLQRGEVATYAIPAISAHPFWRAA